MRIDDQTVRRVADLARLELDADELTRLGGTLQRILDYVAELDALPAAAALELGGAPTPERDDAALPSLPAEVAVASAADKSGTAFQVPRILA